MTYISTMYKYHYKKHKSLISVEKITFPRKRYYLLNCITDGQTNKCIFDTSQLEESSQKYSRIIYISYLKPNVKMDKQTFIIIDS